MPRLILSWYREVHSVHATFLLISAQCASDFQNDLMFSTKLYHGLDTEISNKSRDCVFFFIKTKHISPFWSSPFWSFDKHGNPREETQSNTSFINTVQHTLCNTQEVLADADLYVVSFSYECGGLVGSQGNYVL